jgi:hypothetical protein
MAGKHFAERHEEFPSDDPGAVAALQARVVGLIRADKFGADISETMELAYEQLIGEGIIRPIRDETPPVPPSLSGASGVNSVVDPETLNDADLKAYMRSRGMNV